MVMDVKFLSREKEEKLREAPSNYRERLVRWGRLHPKISMVTGLLFIIALIYSILPLGLLYFLPDFIVKQIVYILIGGIPGYYGGRWLYRKLGRPKTEIIYELNLANTPMIDRYRKLRGSFKEDFEFKNGSPVESRRADGIPVYTVVNIDWEENVAYCSNWGDLPQAKLFETKEAIRAQFLHNDELRKLGSEINMKLEQIISQVEHQYANAFIRKLETVAHPEDLMEAGETGIPKVKSNIETPDLDDILDKTQVQNPHGLEPKNQADSNEQ